MKDNKPVDINAHVNLITRQVKKNIEDRKTSIFIVVSAVNIFLWGLFLSEYRDTNSQLQELKDKYELVQLMLQKVKK